MDGPPQPPSNYTPKAKRTQLFEYTRPYLYPKQLAAIFDTRRISCVEASTKSGKTSGCIVWIFEQAMAGSAGHNFWWVAPVSGQADIAFRRACRAMPAHLYTVNLTHKTITLINGAVIWFKSADKPDSLYGEDVYAAVIDEASRVKAPAWHAVRSTLTATRGPLRVIGNVKGRKNWFYDLSRRAAQGDAAMGYHKLVAADAVAAGILAAEEIEEARSQLPEMVFKELYLAEPSDDQGNPFGYAAIKSCIAPLSGRPAATWGWDLAKSVDWTVGIALDDTNRTTRFERWQSNWESTTQRIVAITGGVPALVDSTGVGDPVLERLQTTPSSHYEGYQFTSPSKQKLMEGLAVAIQGQHVTFPDGEIVDELDVFEYTYTKNGGVKYSAPEGYHDDCVMALALAVNHRSHAKPSMMRKITPAVLAAAARPGPATQPWRMFS